MTRRTVLRGGLMILVSAALFSCVTEEVISTTNLDGMEQIRRDKVDSIQQVKVIPIKNPSTLNPKKL